MNHRKYTTEPLAGGAAASLVPPPASSRIKRILRRPVVLRTDDDLGYEEGYSTAKEIPRAAASIVQGVLDAFAYGSSHGAPGLLVVAALGSDGRLASAHATTDPSAVLPRRAERRRGRPRAGRVTS